MKRSIYRSIRRLGIFDVQAVFVGRRSVRLAVDISHDESVDSRFRIMPPTEARAACHSEPMRQRLGVCQPEVISKREVVMGTDVSGDVIAFCWTAYERVLELENFARTPRLGWPMDLETDEAYLFNAWVDPAHRGRGLFPRLIRHLMEHRPSIETFVATVDWTNDSSRRCFQKLGFQCVGFAKHFRLGPLRYFNRVNC